MRLLQSFSRPPLLPRRLRFPLWGLRHPRPRCQRPLLPPHTLLVVRGLRARPCYRHLPGRRRQPLRRLRRKHPLGLPLLPFLGPAPLPTAARVRSAAYSLRPSVEAEEAPVLRSAEEFLFTDADAFLDLDYEIKNVVEEGPSVLLSPDGGYFDLNVAGAKPEPDASFCLSESSDVAVVPNMSKTLPMAGIRCDPAVARAERKARLVRYREKRKNRRFEKTIRYATRKAYAEARPRIKGRFVKRAEVETEVDRIYSSAAEAVAALMAEDDYGVVPSY